MTRLGISPAPGIGSPARAPSGLRAPPGRVALGLLVLGLLALAMGAACSKGARFTEPQQLGGKTVTAALLGEGYAVYMHYCYACHGEKGDGWGPAAPTMRPAPRDFRTGMFKFAGVLAGGLPNDADLERLLERGLAGTPMLPWDLGPRQRRAVVAFIKTFSPRWRDEVPGEPIVADGPDPWVGKKAEAIAHGETLYHLSGAKTDPQSGELEAVYPGCNVCHPSYLDPAALAVLSQKVLGTPALDRENLARPMLKESSYALGEVALSILPPDFLFHPVKNGDSPADLFRTIAAGVGGTAMVGWKGTIKDDDLWALAHYVHSLLEKRDTLAAIELKRRLLMRPPLEPKKKGAPGSN